jgi:hypothetical protein
MESRFKIPGRQSRLSQARFFASTENTPCEYSNPQLQAMMSAAQLQAALTQAANQNSRVRLGDVFNYRGDSILGRVVHNNNQNPAQARSMMQFADVFDYGVVYPAAAAVALPVLPVYVEAGNVLLTRAANLYLTNPPLVTEFVETVTPGSLPSTMTTWGPVAGAAANYVGGKAWNWYNGY